MTLDLTEDEHAFLIKSLGGKLDMGTRTLGAGLTALGVLALRKKLEQVSNRDYNPSTATL